MNRRMALILIVVGGLGSAYLAWSLERARVRTVVKDAQWPRPWPYPDRGINALERWYDARHPDQYSPPKPGGEFWRVQHTAFWFLLGFGCLAGYGIKGLRITRHHPRER
jgi:hypothetical protein